MGLGHNSKAVHRAYPKKALVKIPLVADSGTAARGASPGVSEG